MKRRHLLPTLRIGLGSVLASVALLGLAVGAGAQQDGLLVSTRTPSIVVDGKSEVKLSIKFSNTGEAQQVLDLSLEGVPADWKYVLKSGTFGVRRVMVNPKDSEFIDLAITPPDGSEQGDYRFTLRATTPDGAPRGTLPLLISVQKQQQLSDIQARAQFPVIRGEPGAAFGFKVDLTNKASEERAFNLEARPPQGWDVTFKPSFEQTQISTLRLKADENKGLDVSVKSPPRVAGGEYEIPVKISAGGSEVELTFTAVVIGKRELNITTPTGQLNAKATAGQQSPVSLELNNTGSADIRDLTLTSSKPEGWEIQFEPEKVDLIRPGQRQDVTVRIKPSPKAIAGDYMTTMTASGADVSKSVDIRVGVETPTAWAWVGAAVVVLALGGLVVLFWNVGRR